MAFSDAELSLAVSHRDWLVRLADCDLDRRLAVAGADASDSAGSRRPCGQCFAYFDPDPLRRCRVRSLEQAGCNLLRLAPRSRMRSDGAFPAPVQIVGDEVCR